MIPPGLFAETAIRSASLKEATNDTELLNTDKMRREAMAILKAGKLEQGAETQKLGPSLNRGSLWSITQPAKNLFFHTEHTEISNIVNIIIILDSKGLHRVMIDWNDMMIEFAC